MFTMNEKSVVLGFSGGIDSCASARWLTERGYRVVAVTIDTMHDETMLREAQARAEELGIEWLADDAAELFQCEIVDYFTESYRNGLTPAPCTRCNPKIKWRRLREVADRLGIHHIATGHYFRVVEHEGRRYVAKGADPTKDQSYYLWGLDQEILTRALTPMGEAIKSVVKAEVGNRSESMGICFLAGCHYTEFLERRGIELRPGAVRYMEAAIQRCQALIKDGIGFSKALLESGCFSEMHASMISIGYKTSAMDDVMLNISQAYEEETDRHLQRFVAVLEPTLIIILSFFIGLILVSFLLPLLGIMSSIG